MTTEEMIEILEKQYTFSHYLTASDIHAIISKIRAAEDLVCLLKDRSQFLSNHGSEVITAIEAYERAGGGE